MKKHIARAMLVVALASVASLPAHAEECNGEVTEVATEAGTLYVDDRGIDTGGIWIYQESNGEAGLQSGGANALGEADLCAVENPDTLLV